MACASHREEPDPQAPRRVVRLLTGGVLATILLVTAAIGREAGGLFDWLFRGKDPQRMEVPSSQASAPLGTVGLRVEGMVCYS